MKAVVAAFNQEKALVGAFSVITNLRMELFEALSSVHWIWFRIVKTIRLRLQHYAAIVRGATELLTVGQHSHKPKPKLKSKM